MSSVKTADQIVNTGGSPDHLKGGSDKYNRHFHEYHAVSLTNRTGASSAVGDVVALSAANDSSVILGDTQASLQEFVVAQAVIADTVAGEYARAGVISGVKATGAIARGQYVRKSATTLTVEDAGVAVGATGVAPAGALGIALTAAAAGVVTVAWFGKTVKPAAALQETAGPTRLTMGAVADGEFLKRSGTIVVGSAPILDRVTADTVVSNTVTETTIYTKNILGGTLSTNRRLRLVLKGQTQITGNNYTVRLKYGATTITSTAHTDVAMAAGTPITITALLSGDGATNAQIGMLIVQAASTTVIFFLVMGRGTAAEDSTADKTLAVTLQMVSAATTNNYTMEQAVLEVL